MAIDRVRPLKLESVAEGGGQDDESVNEVNIGQDYLDCAGISLQQLGTTRSTSDTACTINRPAAGQLAFTDTLSGTLTLEQLLTSVRGLPGSHASTPDILHWVGPPGDGFVSGAFRQTTLTGLLPSSVVWWTSSSMTTRLFATTFTYTGILCTQKVHSLYSAGTLVRTLTEVFSYTASLFAPSITRTWS